ncbi:MULTISPECIES: carboxylate-amine ligase [unclassified Lysobacter]|uniref:carboxylate-amine ligase n=1 Tax=unclassified Lysobacter TaxID=2635362 RepID=UPI0006F3314B|nr:MULTISPECIES: carboxylate-amine ligase [unclassified Lysobacter]KQZ57503.1 glutamate--cysteine ligase [Lysobacter sp. Root559]KRC33652.1 glutamate--cysteine ligase [Lysobacter sp. Root76]KRD68989.1 glutamate--cysteine ligase [Lysobacter sp. Root96]
MSEHHDYTYGIEEEYFLVRPGAHGLATRVPAELLRQARRELGDSVANELLQSQIEISSPILRDAGEAERSLIGLRSALSQVAARFDLGLVAAGTHPLGVWREQERSPRSHYRRLMEDFQIVARRSLVCGLHVHVQLPPGVDRVRVMNRMMRWLPLFLALSTSSPFWNRSRTGLLSYRQAVYDEWPRTGVPDFFADEAEYDALAALLTRVHAINDARSLWWGIRPSPRFPTLELRIADCCTRVRDALAIAALYRCLLRYLVRCPDDDPPRSALTRRVIDENRWRAKRFGIEAKFFDESGADPEPLPQMLARLRELCAQDIRALDSAAALAPLDAIVAQGSSAHAQLALYREQRDRGLGRVPSLEAVVDWLRTTTAASD